MVAKLLPRPARLGAARAVGRVAGRSLPAEWQAVRGNLERVLPGASPREVDVLTRAAGAPLIPAFCTMAADGLYCIEVDAPIRVKSGEETAGLETMVAALGRAVRAHPTQWFNFFDVWASPVAAA
jgi:lauroyl/myristoyl acyltransferase